MPFDSVNVASKNRLGELPVYVTPGENLSAVIVLQEWWGVNDQIKEQAERWYSNKHMTLIPDLYRGKVAIDHETAGHYMNDLDWQGAVQDIQAAVDYLKTSRGVKKIGIVGFCMGGALTLASASLVDGIDAAAPFYGIGQLGDPALAKCPLQLHFGDKDALVGFSDITAQNSLEQKLKEGSREFTFYRYKGAGHAFCNSSNEENFRQDYADLARESTLEFFAKNLSTA